MNLLEGDPSVSTKQRGCQDIPVLEQGEWDKRFRRDVFLIKRECNQAQHADDQHRDHRARPPLVCLIASQAERQQDQGKSCHAEQDTEDVELDHPVLDRLPPRPAPGCVALRLDQTQLLCFSEVDCEDEYHRRANSRDDDAERPEAPSPRASLQDGLGRSRASKGVGNIRGRREAEEDHAVLELASVGNENLQHVADSIHAGPEKDLSSGVGLDIAAGGHQNQS